MKDNRPNSRQATTLKGHPASKAHAKADDPIKAAAKLPGMDPSMLKL
jgi:hypothetical protein